MPPRTQQKCPIGARGGFTLIELCVVIFIIALLSAFAVPQLLPMVAFSEHEGSARHLSSYGDGVMAQAALMREKLTVRFDLDKQEYYTVRWIDPPSDSGEGEGEQEDQFAKLDAMKSSGDLDPDQMAAALAAQRSGSTSLDAGKLPDGFDPAAADKQMGDKFTKFARHIVETQAKNVKQGNGFLDEIGPLFDKKFSIEDDEPKEQELDDNMLQRQALPEGVRIESVVVGGQEKNKGVVEVEISPLGLTDPVAIYVSGNNGEYYTVVWDPVTAGSDVIDGKVDL